LTADAFSQYAQRSDVIEVRVRVHEILRAKLVLFENGCDAFDVVTAVYDDRFSARLVAQNAAVATQWPDGEM